MRWRYIVPQDLLSFTVRDVDQVLSIVQQNAADCVECLSVRGFAGSFKSSSLTHGSDRVPDLENDYEGAYGWKVNPIHQSGNGALLGVHAAVRSKSDYTGGHYRQQSLGACLLNNCNLFCLIT